MFRLSRLAALSVLLAAAFVVPSLAPAAQAATSDQQALVDRARLTIDDVHKDKAFGNSNDLLRKARAILIVPRLYKGGFFVGGEGGDGVLLARTAHGWSQPAFYAMGSASFGLQIGLEQSELVMFIMSQKALNAVLKDQFKVGADAGLAIVTLGSTVGGATTAAVGADIVVWASNSGAYAGITVNGSIIKPSAASDRAYYGHSVTTRDIIYHGVGGNAGAAGLRAALGAG